MLKQSDEALTKNDKNIVKFWGEENLLNDEFIAEGNTEKCLDG